MATPRLFKLKSEVASAPSGPKALVLPIARLRVDTGVFHLDQLYDYVIPERISEQIQTGVRVQIPFGNRETEGIVVERVAQPERAGELKTVTKVLSIHPVATTESLNLMDLVAQKYACNPWDVIRSAIPPRIASVDKIFSHHSVQRERKGKSKLSFETLHPYIESHQQIAALVEKHLKNGSILVVAPDEKDVDLICESVSSLGLVPLKITAAMPREERYANYLQAMNEDDSIVVGTRSSIFVPVKSLATIILFKESSVDHYEVRSPGWNAREIAILRSKMENLALFLTGFSPSIEVALKIENREIEYSNTRENVSVKAFTPSDGSLLPGRIFSEIRAALKEGPVLFIAPRKGYGNAVLCAHCRNIAQCSCGGRLTVASSGANPTCVHCGSKFQQWKCTFCQRDKQYLAARGIDRASEELSRAFPGYPVILSAGDVIKKRIDNKPALVLATPGSQPQVAEGYSAVVILDGTRFFAHTDLRTAERARELFLESSSLISKKGSVLLVIDDSHPIVASIARWNIAPMLKRELAEREELALPPYSTSAVLVVDQLSAAQIHSGLKKAIDQGRLPDSTRIFGPTIIAKGQAKIVLHVDNAQAQLMISTLHELQRKRSIAKKDLFTIRINPYSL
ncbi:MAG: hypothetical protein RL129_1145 [Actinomycetota bacterium]